MKNKEQRINSFRFHKDFFSLVLIQAGIALVAAILIPVALVIKDDILLTIAGIIVIVAVLVSLVMLILVVRKYIKDSNEFAKELDEQVKAFKDGVFRTSDKKYKKTFPALSEVQGKMNEAIAHYTNYELVFVGRPSDYKVEKDIKDGVVYDEKEFGKNIFVEVQNNRSYRSAVIFLKLLGSNNIEEKDFKQLVEKTREAFPGSMLGKFGSDTLALYLFNVESCLGLQVVCEKFATKFNILQINPTSGQERLIYAKIGGVIYPYCSLNTLVDDALSNLNVEGDVNISYGVKDVYFPKRVLTESSKRILFLANFEKYEADIRNAKDYSSEIEALKAALQWLSNMAGYEVFGVYEYGAATDDYRLLFEKSRSENEYGFSKFGNILASSMIKPFVDEAKKDSMFVGNASEHLPKALSEPILSLGMEGFFFASLDGSGNDYGFVYMLSKNKHTHFSINFKEDLVTAISFFTNTIVSSVLAHRNASINDLLNNLTSRTGRYLYSVDRPTHKITYLSENMKHAFPEAKIGDVCYKVFRGNHTKPCSRCPLIVGSDRRVISAIGPAESQLSILQHRGANNDESTIMIEQANATGIVAGSHLVDDNLLIRNSQALSIEVNRELKTKTNRGYVVSIRMVDYDAALRALPGSDANSMMASVVANFQDAGYADLIYRYDQYTIVFLLKGYTKIKAMDFVEEAAEILSHPIEVRDVKFGPQYAYSSIAYPAEVVTTKQLLQTIKDELDRSEKTFGPGHVTEVSNRHPRKALRSEYISDILTTTLDADALPVLTQPIVDGGTFKPIAGNIRAALYGRDKQAIAPREFIPIAIKEKLVSKVDLGALSMMANLFTSYGYKIFKDIGIKSLAMYLSTDSLEDESFPAKVREIITVKKIPSGYIHLQVNAQYFLDYENEIRRFMDELRPIGVIFECVDFTPEKVPLDVIKGFGVRIIKTERSLIWNAASNENELGNFSRFLDAANRNDFEVYVTGIENEEQRDLASSLGAKALEGFLFGKPMSEEEFIKALNYNK